MVNNEPASMTVNGRPAAAAEWIELPDGRRHFLVRWPDGRRTLYRGAETVAMRVGVGDVFLPLATKFEFSVDPPPWPQT